MAGLFISHSSRDSKLALRMVELIQVGIGVPTDQIFCTSIPGQIAPGQDFKAEIRGRLDNATALVPILSLAFEESQFCMYELGAFWAQSKLIMPVLVPPVTAKHMSSIIDNMQAINIVDATSLDQMRNGILTALQLRGHPIAKWKFHRERFLHDLSPLIDQSDNWIYALVSNRPEGAHKILGWFSVRRVPNYVNAIHAVGYAYWVIDSVSLRGEWKTDEALSVRSRLILHYTMRSPPGGEARRVPKSQIHEGVIVLDHNPDIDPVIGSQCFTGYVHDLFDWRDNDGPIYAERVDLRRASIVSMIEQDGRDLFTKFSERLPSPR